ncbi:MAG: thiamine pyrophosphate-dependent dehydrogenase E1 component subunit alpha [Candidatus Geothermarchaeales archaeon]
MSEETPIGREKAIWMYRKMLQIRRFEEKMADLYRRGLVPSSAHVYIGQEAVATGVCAGLRRDDYVLTTHRGHAHNIAKDVPLGGLAAEILGKATGLCKGRGGSMRVSYVDAGVLYACPIVGANIPISVGVGLSIKLRDIKRVVACFFGDGASNIGDFHEGLNLASLWGLPVIFVCENNLYGLSVSLARATLVENIADRAASYEMPGVVVDGNDVIAVYEATLKAVERARRGEGPTLIECKTYRWLGHHVGDPGTAYRSREEVEAWKRRCPIARHRRRLFEMGVPEEELNLIDEEVGREVEEAIKFAVDSPYPEPRELMGPLS